MMQGLPGSGKTTEARKIVKDSGNAARINRDDLRAMLFDSVWSGKRENIVINAEQAIAKVLLDFDITPVIDDTNFGKNEDLWKNFLRSYNGTDLDVKLDKKFINTPVDVCIERDSKRIKSVGANVINKFAAKNNLIEWPDKPIVLVDIDGTLAQSTGREKHLESTPKNWKAYFEELHTDLPITPIFSWVKSLSEDHTIVIVSGRGAEYEKETLAWFDKIWEENPLFPELNVPKFPVFKYFFRSHSDRRDDTEVKLEVLDYLPAPPVLIIDDRPKVVKAWRSRGLKVIPVAGACEEF